MFLFSYSPQAEQLHETIVSYGLMIVVVSPLASVHAISTSIDDVCAGAQQRHVFLVEPKTDIEYEIQPPRHSC